MSNVADFFTETATHERLSTTTKTLRTWLTLTDKTVSEPQPDRELDLLEGQHVTQYRIYAAFGEDILENDRLTVNGFVYLVNEILPNKVRDIEFIKILCTRD